MPAIPSLPSATSPAGDVVPKEDLARGIKTVLSGQGAAYVITFGTLPLLAMIYSPYDFAALGIYTAIAVVVGAACTFCFSNTVPLASDDNTAVNALAVAMGLSTITALAATAALLFVPAPLVAAMELQWITSYRWLLGATIASIGWQQSLTCWCVRRQTYKSLARGRVSLTLARVAAQLSLGLVVVGPGGLIVGFALGNFVGTLVLAIQCRSDRGLVRQITWHDMQRVIRSYRQFALFGTLPEVVQRLAVHLPSLLLAATYNYQVAGWYVLTQRVFGAPQTMLQQAVSRVFLGVGARQMEGNPQGLRYLFGYTLRKMLLLTSAPYLLFMLLAPTLFGHLLDDTWAAAGIYCSLLTPMFFARLLYDSLRPTIDLLKRPQLHTSASLLITAALTLGILVPYAFGWSATLAIVTLSSMVLVGQLLALYLVWVAIKASPPMTAVEPVAHPLAA